MIINIEYNGGPNAAFDAALAKLFGGYPGSSGCCLFGDFTRDAQYDYKWKSKKQYAALVAKAKAAATKLKIKGFEMDDCS